MKHLAIKSLSTNKQVEYTTPGLGDRIHTALFAYNYSIQHNAPVTIHLTDGKWSIAKGVPSEVKKESWREILDLLPKDSVYVQPHPVSDISEVNWIKYLNNKGIDAIAYKYEDTNHRYDTVPGLNQIDISEYLKAYPCVQPKVNINLPQKFVTAQFDSNNVPYWKDNLADSRKIPAFEVDKIINQYKSIGYDIVFVGGDGEERFNGPGKLKNVVAAMSKADYHLGTDSGFSHLAHLCMKPNQIKLYTRGANSHHVVRARNNGVQVINI